MAINSPHSFEMHRGDNRTLTYTVVDQQTPPVVVDITGAVLGWALARQDPSTTTAQPIPGTTLVTKSVGSGITITDGPNGELEIDIASSDTVGFIAPLEYYHELQMTLGGDVTTLVFGKITLKREIVSPGP